MATSVRHAVTLLRARGFAVCKVDPGEKKPTYKAWSTKSLEPDDFQPDDMVGVMGGPLSDCGRAGFAHRSLSTSQTAGSVSRSS